MRGRLRITAGLLAILVTLLVATGCGDSVAEPPLPPSHTPSASASRTPPPPATPTLIPSPKATASPTPTTAAMPPPTPTLAPVSSLTPFSTSTSTPTPLPPSYEVLAKCVQDGDVDIHLHIQLTITLNGRSLPIPPGIGITPDCTHLLHTHDDSGVIHIEHPPWADFTLGDFFLAGQRWGGFDPLAGRQVVRVLANGEPYQGDYRALPLSDGLSVYLILVPLTSA